MSRASATTNTLQAKYLSLYRVAIVPLLLDIITDVLPTAPTRLIKGRTNLYQHQTCFPQVTIPSVTSDPLTLYLKSSALPTSLASLLLVTNPNQPSDSSFSRSYPSSRLRLELPFSQFIFWIAFLLHDTKCNTLKSMTQRKSLSHPLTTWPFNILANYFPSLFCLFLCLPPCNIYNLWNKTGIKAYTEYNF